MRTTRRKALKLAGGALTAGAVPLAAEAGSKGCEPSAFLEVFAKRQTVRRYKPDPVPEEHLRQILDAARRGPTCMNQQPGIFLVVRDRAKIEQMKKLTLDRLTKYFDGSAAKSTDPAALEKRKKDAIHFTEGYFTAPVYVAVLVDTESACSGYATNHDGPIAAGYLMLAARAFGYGTAYLTDGIPEAVVREVLAIPRRYYRVCVTPIGIPDGWPPRQPKRKLEEMVAYETLEGHPPLTRLPYNY
jgi:nitroreductase